MTRLVHARRRLLQAAALAALATLGACAGQASHVSADNPSGRPMVYPITADQADAAIAQSVTQVFPGTPASSVSLPYRGYTVTIRILLDSHQITAYAVPAPGGYSFQVDHSGTIPITGSSRAAELLAAIRRRASAIAPPLPAN